MKGNVLIAAAAVCAAAASVASANDIYIDANADAGGAGTCESPYNTLAEGFSHIVAGSRVFVRGGVDRAYEMDGRDDLLVIDKADVTVACYGGEGPAQIVASSELSANMDADPTLLLVAEGGDDVVVSGLSFYFHGANAKTRSGNSLGQYGRCIAVAGHRAVIDGCAFTMSAKSQYAWGGECMVRCLSEERTPNIGTNLCVRGCIFGGNRNSSKMPAIRVGLNSHIVGNTFSDGDHPFAATKQCGGDFQFVSNRILNCSSVQTTTGNYREIPCGEVAYNIFTNSDSSAVFLLKGRYGLGDAGAKIHHNTVVGGSAFVHVSNVSTTSWEPDIYANLILLAGGGTNIVETGTGFPAGNTSSFATGGAAAFTNNAYLAGTVFNGGTATELEGYDRAHLRNSPDVWCRHHATRS